MGTACTRCHLCTPAEVRRRLNRGLEANKQTSKPCFKPFKMILSCFYCCNWCYGLSSELDLLSLRGRKTELKQRRRGAAELAEVPSGRASNGVDPIFAREG